MLKRLLIFLALAVGTMAAQGAQRGPAQATTNNNGAVTVVSGAYVTVCSYPACGPVNIYQNPGLSVLQSNPVVADANGNYTYWASPGNYIESVFSPGTGTRTIILTLGGAGGGGGGTPCGTLDDVQLNGGSGTFGCDTGIFIENPTNHTAQDTIFKATMEVDVTAQANGYAQWDHWNGASFDYHYIFGVSPTFGVTYGISPPDAAPSQVGQAMVISSLTPVSGLTPTTWGLPNGKVSAEDVPPVMYAPSGCHSPATCSDIAFNLYAQGVSQPLQGPPPAGQPATNIVQSAQCSTGSVAAITCTFPGPSIPGDIIYVITGAVTGTSVQATFVVTDTLSDSYTVLDYINGSLVGTLPSTNLYAVVPAGATAPIAVTSTPTSSCGGTCIATVMQIYEVNATTVDVHDHGTSITGSTISCPSITTTHNPDVLLCSAFAYTNPAQNYAPGSSTYALLQTTPQAGASSNVLTEVTEAGNITTPAATVATILTNQSSLLTNFAVAFKTGSTAGSQKPTFRPRLYYDVTSEQSWGFDVGVADAYVVAPTGCVTPITSQPPTEVHFTPANANATTTPTLNYCNTGATTIRKRGTSGSIAPVASDMVPGLQANFTFDGTYWILTNPASVSGSGVSFTNITTGTNTTATMTVGAGASLTFTSTGIVNADEVNGAAVPASATVAATNSSKQVIAAGLTSADIWVGNGSNLPAAVAASGDVTLANTGAFTVTGVNGAAVAASAAPACTNSSRQITSCTATYTQTICSGTVTINPGSLSTNTCSSAQTATCTGLATTDNIMLDFNADPTSTTGYEAGTMMTLVKYPTSNTINVKVCNNTSGTVVPSSVTANYRVVR